MFSPIGPRRLLVVGGGLLAVCLGAQALHRAVIGHFDFYDDTYYYLVPARNFLASGRFTFDGVTLTNGFHPAWMALVVAALSTLGPNPSLESQLASLAILQVIVQVLSVVAATVAADRAFRRGDRAVCFGFIAAGLVYVLPNTRGLFASGLEAALAGLLTIVALALVLEGKRGAGLGTALALLGLARLDTLVFFVAPWLVYIAFFERTPVRRLVAIGAPLAVGIGGYLALNFHAFGHFVPISGALKSSFPVPMPKLWLFAHPFELMREEHRPSFLLIPNLDSLVVLGLAGALLCWRLPRAPALRAVAVIALLPMLNWLLYQRWSRGVEPWYLGVPTILVAFTLWAGLARVPSLSGRRFAIANALGATAAAALLLSDLARHTPSADPRKSPLIAWMRGQPPDAVFASTDSGIQAFFSERRVVNLDGLVNDWSFQDRLIEPNGLARYLKQQGVRFLLVGARSQNNAKAGREPMWSSSLAPEVVRGPEHYARFDFDVFSYLHGRHSEPMVLVPSQEAFSDPKPTFRTIAYDLVGGPGVTGP